MAKCSRCSGFAALVLEFNAIQLKVVRCLICGHRVYPQGWTADDDYDGNVELLEAMGKIDGKGYWVWLERKLRENPGKY